MIAKIVQTRIFLTLLGGGSTHFSHVKQALTLAPILIAADSGADTALEYGLTPEAVIGDMDSLSPEGRAAFDPASLHQIAEQDTTDFEKCLQRIDAAAVLALGFIGSRLDHTLTNCSVLTRYTEYPVILIGEEDICFLAPETLMLDLPPGSLLSIFPMAPTRGTSEGLKFPIDGLELSPLGLVGTSNEVTGPVRLRFEDTRPLILLPHAALETALAALTKVG